MQSMNALRLGCVHSGALAAITADTGDGQPFLYPVVVVDGGGAGAREHAQVWWLSQQVHCDDRPVQAEWLLDQLGKRKEGRTPQCLQRLVYRRHLNTLWPGS